jgi:hypothetical protein
MSGRLRLRRSGPPLAEAGWSRVVASRRVRSPGNALSWQRCWRRASRVGLSSAASRCRASASGTLRAAPDPPKISMLRDATQAASPHGPDLAIRCFVFPRGPRGCGRTRGRNRPELRVVDSGARNAGRSPADRRGKRSQNRDRCRAREAGARTHEEGQLEPETATATPPPLFE